MKIILKDNVANLGAIGETVKVAAGYGRNYLIPRGMAVEATKGNVRQFEAERESWVKKADGLKADADGIARALADVELSFERKSGADEEDAGKIFGSVTTMDIEAALKEKGHEVPRKIISLEEPIKRLGEFTVSVKLHPEVIQEIKVTVEKES